MKILSKPTLLLAAILSLITISSTFANTRDNLTQTASDSVITVKIKSKLVAEKITSAKDISVETNNSIVTLKGIVSSQAEAAKAVEIAESTQGVQKVDSDNLTVANSTQPLKDIYLAAKVKGAFIRYNLTAKKAKTVPVNSVEVEVREGVANLTGTVKYKWQIAKLTELAKSVDGISQVNSLLETKN